VTHDPVTVPIAHRGTEIAISAWCAASAGAPPSYWGDKGVRFNFTALHHRILAAAVLAEIRVVSIGPTVRRVFAGTQEFLDLDAARVVEELAQGGYLDVRGERKHDVYTLTEREAAKASTLRAIEEVADDRHHRIGYLVQGEIEQVPFPPKDVPYTAVCSKCGKEWGSPEAAQQDRNEYCLSRRAE
jgi:hypothetical protein